MRLGRFICALPKWIGGGHLRGMRVFTPDGAHRVFACPRCGNETRYKEKPRKPHSGNNGAPSDGSESFRGAM